MDYREVKGCLHAALRNQNCTICEDLSTASVLIRRQVEGWGPPSDGRSVHAGQGEIRLAVNGGALGGNGRTSGVISVGAPGGEELSTRRCLQVLTILRHLAPGGTCPPLGDLEIVAPNGTCPRLGDLAAVSPSYWTLQGVVQGFWWYFKGKIVGFLELSSERIL